ncbi:hypothetical protein BAE44_0013161 [Dichanthelium oligosanthes]|uniref:Uncharacterized protein n=1 Tax=Dichanthelium oligosanthes TaxID=888268 RepID=A0A1E5VL16_9POAL|nr:hypothetical protein BAE44_0013161 [Dichanthelium oligosanthes]
MGAGLSASAMRKPTTVMPTPARRPAKQRTKPKPPAPQWIPALTKNIMMARPADLALLPGVLIGGVAP